MEKCNWCHLDIPDDELCLRDLEDGTREYYHNDCGMNMRAIETGDINKL